MWRIEYQSADHPVLVSPPGKEFSLEEVCQLLNDLREFHRPLEEAWEDEEDTSPSS